MTAAHKEKKVSFFKEFLKDRNIAAIQPSSPHLMRRLLRLIDTGKAQLIVELGPGEGVAARAILPELGPEARYVAIERNPSFVNALKALSALDHRFTVIEGRAQDLSKIMAGNAGKVDAVIASIPFTFLKKAERVTLLADVRKLLRPGGVFIIFHQYLPTMVPYLAKEFADVRVEYEALNVFPCFLMRVQKDA